MVSLNRALAMMIGAAAGAFCLAPGHASAQDSPPVSCADLYSRSPLEDLLRCADGGNARAQSALGLKYSVGAGVPEDDVEAVRWYRLAAEQGHAGAQLGLGTMYSNGDGVPEDAVLAYMWWHLSAAQGNGSAQEAMDIIEGSMTRERIAEAERLSREWSERHRQEGGN